MNILEHTVQNYLPSPTAYSLGLGMSWIFSITLASKLSESRNLGCAPMENPCRFLLLEVYIQKPTFKDFLMTQSLNGKANLGFLIDLLLSSTL